MGQAQQKIQGPVLTSKRAKVPNLAIEKFKDRNPGKREEIQERGAVTFSPSPPFWSSCAAGKDFSSIKGCSFSFTRGKKSEQNEEPHSWVFTIFPLSHCIHHTLTDSFKITKRVKKKKESSCKGKEEHSHHFSPSQYSPPSPVLIHLANRIQKQQPKQGRGWNFRNQQQPPEHRTAE